jgi:hypothetical protein
MKAHAFKSALVLTLMLFVSNLAANDQPALNLKGMPVRVAKAPLRKRCPRKGGADC